MKIIMRFLLAAALLAQPCAAGYGWRQEASREQEAESREKTKLTGKQLDLCDECTDAVESARLEARQLREYAAPTIFNKTTVQKQLEQLKTAVDRLEREHGTFVKSLKAEQRENAAGELRELEHLRRHLASTLKEMARELEASSSDPKRIAKHAVELEKALLEWKMRQQNLFWKLGERK